MRARPFRIRRTVAVAATAALAIGGVALLSVGVASATADTAVENLSAFTLNPVTLPSIFTGGTNAGRVELHLHAAQQLHLGRHDHLHGGPERRRPTATARSDEWVGFSGTPAVVAVAPWETPKPTPRRP